MKLVHRPPNSFDFKRFVLKPVIPILLAILLIVTLATDFLQDRLQNGWEDMTDLVSVEVHRIAEGEAAEEFYDRNTFPVVNKGDILTVRVELPEERRVENAVIGFNIPHVTGFARWGDEILWSYGQELYAQGKFIGNLFFRVPVKDEMWGGSMELVLEVVEDNAFSSIPNVQAMPAVSSIRYFFSQFQMDMFLFLGFFIIFVLAFLVFLFYWGGGELRLEGLYLSAFCVLLGGWFLSGHGFFYAFSDNIGICAHLEYVAFYLLPIPFCLFMCVQVKTDRLCRIFSEVMASVFIVLFIVVTVLNYTTADHHYSKFLLLLQAFMLVGVIGFVIMLMRNQYSEDLSRRIIRYGVAISMLILMLEVARYNLSKFFFVDSKLDELSFASTGMLVFAGALTVGYIARLTAAVGEESDKALLRRMAYVDVLTGISNRTYCHQKIEEMEKSGEKYFALLFFDLNGLKWANDNFGHDMGDRFIQAVADILQNIFGQQRFCGRWGGDEFIACLTGRNVKYAESMLRDFDGQLKLLNDSGQFPFHVSVAYGMVRSTEQQVLSMDEALKEADRRMYTAKIRMYGDNELPGEP